MGLVIGMIKVIFLLGFLVFIHEGGHFAVAKLCKINVKEFSLGFGPKIFSKQGKETKYSVKYNYNGGVESEVVDTNNGDGYKSGDTFSVSDKKGKLPVREGFVFTGWKLEGSNPAQIYNANDVFSINAENEKYAVPGSDGKYQYTFTAQWKKLDEVSDLPFIVNVYFPDAEGKYTQPNVSLKIGRASCRERV